MGGIHDVLQYSHDSRGNECSLGQLVVKGVTAADAPVWAAVWQGRLNQEWRVPRPVQEGDDILHGDPTPGYLVP